MTLFGVIQPFTAAPATSVPASNLTRFQDALNATGVNVNTDVATSWATVSCANSATVAVDQAAIQLQATSYAPPAGVDPTSIVHLARRYYCP